MGERAQEIERILREQVAQMEGWLEHFDTSAPLFGNGYLIFWEALQTVGVLLLQLARTGQATVSLTIARQLQQEAHRIHTAMARPLPRSGVPAEMSAKRRRHMMQEIKRTWEAEIAPDISQFLPRLRYLLGPSLSGSTISDSPAR